MYIIILPSNKIMVSRLPFVVLRYKTSPELNADIGA